MRLYFFVKLKRKRRTAYRRQPKPEITDFDL